MKTHKLIVLKFWIKGDVNHLDHLLYFLFTHTRECSSPIYVIYFKEIGL